MGGTKTTSWRRLPLLAALVALVSIIILSAPPSAEAAVSRDAFEHCLLERANEARSAAGLAPVEMAHELVPAVRDWSRTMRFNGFEHMDDQVRRNILPDSWTMWAENIARTSNQHLPDCESIHQGLMGSPGHRANILRPTARFIAIGTYVDGSGWWATQLFFNATGYTVTCSGTFCDDDGSVFESDIERIAAAGITAGCNPPTNNRYCPRDLVTRGEMAAFLSRTLDLPQSAVTFSDSQASLFASDIQRIAAAGITRGCNPPANTRYCPDDPVTRGQMAAFLARALDHLGR